VTFGRSGRDPYGVKVCWEGKQMTRHVVSVSLGAPSGNMRQEAEFLALIRELKWRASVQQFRAVSGLEA